MAIGRDWCFDKNRMNLCLPELDLGEELREDVSRLCSAFYSLGRRQ